MDEESGASLEPTPEQVRYAEVLEKGMLFGLLCLIVTFALYVFGIMEPYVPLEQLSQHWQKNVDQYLAEAKIEAGWSWVGMLKYGDFLNFSRDCRAGGRKCALLSFHYSAAAEEKGCDLRGSGDVGSHRSYRRRQWRRQRGALIRILLPILRRSRSTIRHATEIPRKS